MRVVKTCFSQLDSPGLRTEIYFFIATLWKSEPLCGACGGSCSTCDERMRGSVILAMECGGDCSLPLLSFLLFETLRRETGTGTLSSEDIFLLSRGAHPIPGKRWAGEKSHCVFCAQASLSPSCVWLASVTFSQFLPLDCCSTLLPWTRPSLLTSMAERLGLD